MAEFHLDRDRGYTFAYTLIGWTLRKGYDAKSSWRDGLGEAMRRAEADHAFLRLECTADYSDQIVLGMQVQGGAEHHDSREDRDSYGDGMLGFEVSSLPTPAQLTTWSAAFDAIGAGAPGFSAVY